VFSKNFANTLLIIAIVLALRQNPFCTQKNLEAQAKIQLHKTRSTAAGFPTTRLLPLYFYNNEIKKKLGNVLPL
jgi:hypothetical protein